MVQVQTSQARKETTEVKCKGHGVPKPRVKDSTLHGAAALLALRLVSRTTLVGAINWLQCMVGM